ncbi:MAG: hypothetical protein LBN37_01635, partial [Bacteroidales bacterium]|nr:hypothetical protein [Bacteroidales bacterium]
DFNLISATPASEDGSADLIIFRPENPDFKQIKAMMERTEQGSMQAHDLKGTPVRFFWNVYPARDGSIENYIAVGIAPNILHNYINTNPFYIGLFIILSILFIDLYMTVWLRTRYAKSENLKT